MKKLLNYINIFHKMRHKKTTLAGIMAILGAVVQAYEQGGVDALIIALVTAGIGLINGSDGGV